MVTSLEVFVGKTWLHVYEQELCDDPQQLLACIPRANIERVFLFVKTNSTNRFARRWSVSTPFWES